MKYLLLLTILFSGCDFNNEIEVSVKDATTEKIDSVNVYIAAAAYSFKEIAPGETKKITQIKKNIKGGADGFYFLNVYNHNLQVRPFVFGYYTNGSAVEDTIHLTISDSIIESRSGYRQ
jgi:hypothetical protein